MVWAAVGVVALTGCGGGGDDDEDAAPEPPPTTTTVPPPVTPPQVAPTTCQPASEGDVTSINLTMTLHDLRVGDAYTATVGSYRYVAGNLRDSAGAPVGVAVWAFDGEVLHSVSELATTHSQYFPPRGPLGPEADDATVAALTQCVPAA